MGVSSYSSQVVTVKTTSVTPRLKETWLRLSRLGIQGLGLGQGAWIFTQGYKDDDEDKR
jgi:hypothetical protein